MAVLAYTLIPLLQQRKHALYLTMPRQVFTVNTLIPHIHVSDRVTLPTGLMCMQRDPTVGVLLMDETGSVGLDLSFVSWVFLMEPLADLSLQAQVTARAHRMGATQAIRVETLVMKVRLCVLRKFRVSSL